VSLKTTKILSKFQSAHCVRSFVCAPIENMTLCLSQLCEDCAQQNLLFSREKKKISPPPSPGRGRERSPPGASRPWFRQNHCVVVVPPHPPGGGCDWVWAESTTSPPRLQASANSGAQIWIRVLSLPDWQRQKTVDFENETMLMIMCSWNILGYVCSF